MSAGLELAPLLGLSGKLPILLPRTSQEAHLLLSQHSLALLLHLGQLLLQLPQPGDDSERVCLQMHGSLTGLHVAMQQLLSNLQQHLLGPTSVFKVMLQVMGYLSQVSLCP